MKFQLVRLSLRILRSTSSPPTGRKFSCRLRSELAVKPTRPSMTVTASLPNRILLLASTTAWNPMAVALVKLPTETSALDPRAVLLLPMVFLRSASNPLAVLLAPVVFS